jgi:hypothetical protein
MERASRREPLFHPQDNLKRQLPLPSEMETDREPEEALEPLDPLEAMEDLEALEPVEADMAG